MKNEIDNKITPIKDCPCHYCVERSVNCHTKENCPNGYIEWKQSLPKSPPPHMQTIGEIQRRRAYRRYKNR